MLNTFELKKNVTIVIFQTLKENFSIEKERILKFRNKYRITSWEIFSNRILNPFIISKQKRNKKC